MFEFDITPRDPRPPLHPDRLAAGGTVIATDIQISRRSAWPETAMRRIQRGFWLVFWLAVGFAITSLFWVHP